MKHYYVEGYAGWFVVACSNKRDAKSEGVYEFGRGRVKTVRKATPEEVESFIRQKGDSALETSRY